MPSRMLVVVLLASLCAASIVCFGCLFHQPPADAARDDATEELAAITSHYARMWDHQREDAIDDAHRQEMRARWREAYHADVRACCERHGRPCPAWARD